MISATAASFKARVVSKVSELKVNQVINASWRSFVYAFLAMILFWLLICAGALRLAPGIGRLIMLGTLGPIILGTVLLVFNKEIVNLSMDTKRVKERNDNPVFWDLVNEIAEQEDMTCPKLYTVDTKGMNAFAYGTGVFGDKAVGVTTGLLKNLNQEQIKAVLAHEMGHIKNRDILVSMAMTLTVMVCAFTGWLFMKAAPYAFLFGGDDSDSSSDKKGGFFHWLLIGAGLWLLGGIFYTLGRGFAYILQMFVSRKREHSADATAARIMDTPESLISALETIVKNPQIGGEKSNAAFGFMCTADPDISDFLSTHPTLEKRIEVLRSLAA